MYSWDVMVDMWYVLESLGLTNEVDLEDKVGVWDIIGRFDEYRNETEDEVD